MRWPPEDPYRVQTGFALFGAKMEDGTVILWRRFHYRIQGNGHQKAWEWGTPEPLGPTSPPPPPPQR